MYVSAKEAAATTVFMVWPRDLGRCNHCVHGLAKGLGSVLSVQKLGMCVYQCVLTGGVQQPACSMVFHVLVA